MDKRAYRITMAFFLSICLLIGATSVALNLIVVMSTEERIVVPEEVCLEDGRAILVLGAGIRENSRPSDMLRDRLEVAIRLFKDGFGEVILLSGDRQGDHYDEVAVMRNYCLAAGIPEDNIICDTEGFSTIESIYNAKAKYGFIDVLIVSQKYHLHRAIYIADRLGVNSMGVSADLRGYSGQPFRDIREVAARVKDFVFVEFHRT